MDAAQAVKTLLGTEWGKEADEARREAWAALREMLPFPVKVRHNWTKRHYEFYVQGNDHIVVLEDISAGRLTRRRGECLCETPSRAYSLRHVTSGGDEDEKRIPYCRTCLRIAGRIAR